MNNYERKRLRTIASSVVGKKVLDIGYAQMPNPYLSDFHCTGYDINKPVIHSVYNEEIQGDVKDVNSKLSNHNFDSIIAGEIIEHLENPYQFLRDLHPLLNDEGRLILSTLNPLGFPVIICEYFQIEKFFYTREHTYYFLPRWVKRFLDLCGYNLIQVKPIELWNPYIVLPCPAILSYQLVSVACKMKK